MPSDLLSPLVARQAENLLRVFKAKNWRLGLAESCTGGLLAGAITAIPGSSAVLQFSLVTYANEAKNHFLDVPHAIIHAHGAVSEVVAQAMVTGLLQYTPFIDCGLAITGIAGPDGGSAEKPVGLVYFAKQIRANAPKVHRLVFAGDRTSIRAQAVEFALQWLLETE